MPSVLTDDQIDAILPDRDKLVIADAAIAMVAVGNNPLKSAANMRALFGDDPEVEHDATIMERYAGVIQELADRLRQVATEQLMVMRVGKEQGKVVLYPR
jgi:hypothetical protein